jgi:predicted dehydrogenase
MSAPQPLPGSSAPRVLTRRALLKNGLAGVFACGVAPNIFPARLFGQGAPSNRLTIGLVGNGLIASHHVGILTGRTEDCQIVATCDVVRSKAGKMRERLEKAYGDETESGRATRGIEVYAKHEELLARDDIDVVWVCTPDHWHAAVAKASMLAGKDVYCEKPLTLTVREGRVLVDTARRYGRVLQTGTQQRSNKSFRKAAEIVRNGWIGDIIRIRTRLGSFPAADPLPAEPVPGDFDYDPWLGPTPWRPFNARRVKGDYGGGWRCFLEFGGRKNGDWGAHHFDIIQNALGMDDSGPIEFIPRGFEGCKYQTHVYANGIRVERYEDGLKPMIEFQGTKGTVGVSRDDVTESDPPDLFSRPLRAEDVHLYASDNHHSDFFNCVRTRQRPISDVEAGHRSATVCHLNAMAAQLGRALRWDPRKEEIIGDPVASRLLDRPRRAGYPL